MLWRDLKSFKIYEFFLSKVAGAITFKNYIKRNWKVPEEGPDKIHASDRDQVLALVIMFPINPSYR